MKTLIALSLWVGVPSFAVQYIDCIPMPVENNDHVIVLLKDTQTGTLFLSSGINDDGSTSDSGVLEMKFIRTEKGVTFFHAQNTTANFVFSLPANLVQARSLDYFSANLYLSAMDESIQVPQTLSCFTRLY